MSSNLHPAIIERHSAFLIPSRVSSRDWARGILAIPVLRARRPALKNPPRLRIPPWPAADGPGSRRGSRRKPPLDRRRGTRPRQKAGLSAARDPVGEASPHRNRHEEFAGAGLL